MKRTISCAAAFALAFAQPYTVMCAEQIAESQNSQSVVIAASGETTVTNGKITVSYDSSVLKLDEVKFCSTLKNSLIEVNADIKDTIVIGFAVSSPVTVKDCFAELSFKGMPENASAFDYIKSMTVDELVTEDENGNDVKLPADTLRLASSVYSSTVSCSDSTSDEEGNVSTYLQFSNTLPFTNGTFTVNYDSECMDFSGGETCGILKDAVYEINETEPGTIKFTFISGNVINASGPAVKLDFKGKISSTLEISVTADEFSMINESGKIVSRDISSESGKINISLPVKYADINIRRCSEKGTVSVSLSGGSGATNGVLSVRYKPEALKFESAEICEGFDGVMTEFNEEEPGNIKIVFISDEPLNNGGDFIKIHFTPVKAFESYVYVEADELMKTDSNGNITEIPWKSESEALVECTELGLTEDAETDSVSLFLYPDSHVTNGVFTVKYNPENLKFESAKVTDKFAGVMAEFNEEKPGVIKAVFISDDEITSADAFMKFSFSGLKSGSSEITAEADELMRTEISGEIFEIACLPDSCTVNRELKNTVETTVRFDEAEGVTNGSFTISYDPSEFTFVEAEHINPAGSTTVETAETTPGTVKITFFSDEAAVTSNSDFKIVFAENNDAAPSLTIKIDDVTLMAGTDAVSDFKVSFFSDDDKCKYDVNNDGSVTTLDYIELVRMILGKSAVTPEADIDENGKVDSADLIELIKVLKK